MPVHISPARPTGTRRAPDEYTAAGGLRAPASLPPDGFLRTLDAMLRAAGVRRRGRAAPRWRAAAEHEVPRPEEDQCRDVPARIGRAIVYVEEHLDEALSVERMASEAGLSTYYFARRFRKEVGQTPWAYVREARVEHAKRLLREGVAPAEVALETGFFDQSHLTRVMKALDGQTPGQYQRARGEPDVDEAPTGSERSGEDANDREDTADRKNLQD